MRPFSHYLFFIIILFISSRNISAQSSTEFYMKMAAQASIQHPVQSRFATLSVKHPISMDSVSLIHFHHKYVATMTAGTVLLGGGALIVLSHIFISLLPHYNNNLVIGLAEAGVGTMTAGAIALPIGMSERHRYKKSLRITLAQRGM